MTRRSLTRWINSAKAERPQAEAVIRATKPAPRRMTAAEINSRRRAADQLRVMIRSADPADKAEIYKGLNLALTYQPT